MRRILVATDRTEGAHNALGRACALSREAGAELRIIYASSRATDQDERSIARASLRDEISRFPGAPDKFELDLSLHVVTKEPVAAILDEAERFNPDIIILGAHGEPRFRDVIFGTTASNVAQAAKPPLLIVQTDHRLPYRKLLVAIDENSAEEVLRTALGIGSAIEIFVVHAHGSATQSLLGGGQLLEEVRADQEVFSREVAEVATTFRPGAVAPQIHNIVEEGDAIDVIIRAWKEVKPDVLVMGTHGRTGLSRLLRGSHAEITMLACTSDMLVVPTHPGD